MSGQPITLYAMAVSPYVNKVAAILDYKKLPYRPVFIHPQKKAEIQFSKKKLVPIIDDNGTIVEDSTDIALYLDEHYPTPPILPIDPTQRSVVLAIEDWLDEVFFVEYYAAHNLGIAANRKRVLQMMVQTSPFNALERLALPVVAGIVLRKNIQRAHDHLHKAPQLLDQFEERLGAGPFFGAQSQVSVADLAAYGALSLHLAGELEGVDALRKRSAIDVWIERLRPLTSDGRRLLPRA